MRDEPFDLFYILDRIIALIAQNPAKYNNDNFEHQPFIKICEPVNCLSLFHPVHTQLALTVFDRCIYNHLPHCHWLDYQEEGGGD